MISRPVPVVYGFVNVFGQLTGIASARIMGRVLDGKNQGDPTSWNLVFIIPAVVGSIGALIFVLFGTSESRPWSSESTEFKEATTSKEITQN